MESAVVFLIVNKLDELPLITIKSCSRISNSQIIVGYLHEEDVASLKAIPNINFFHLTPPGDDLRESARYQDFNQQEFFRIVTFKWQLILATLNAGYKVVVYSDLDVYWFRDPVPELIRLHTEQAFDVCIQDDSYSPVDIRLCMGFASFRNSQQSKDFIIACQQQHKDAVHARGKVGDDDIVTNYYLENNFPHWINRLPQYTFPVGRQLNAYARKNQIAGLNAPTPYIFHANWVIGLRNKILLTKKAASLINPQESRLGPYDSVEILLRRKRYELGMKRKKIKMKWHR